MNSPKDYLTDRVQEKINQIVMDTWKCRDCGGHRIEVFGKLESERILALLTSEVEKIADMIKSTNNLRMAKVDGKDDWNDALEQSACKMDALEKEVRKALSDIGGEK